MRVLLSFVLGSLLVTLGLGFMPTPKVRTQMIRSHRTAEDISRLHAGGSLVASTTLAHTIGKLLSRFRIGPAKMKSISKNVGASMSPGQDLVLVATALFFATPVARRCLQMVSTTTGEECEKERFKNFLRRKTILYLDRWGIVNLCSQAARIVLSVYAVDIFAIALDTMGFTFPSDWNLSQFYVKFAFSAWAIKLLLYYKKLVLCRLLGVTEESMGRVDLLNRLVSGGILVIFSSVVLDWLSIKMNNVIATLFAVGSAGTLALTLASQGLVTQVVSGLFLAFSDKMYVGDYVRFGDDTSGKVVELGWLETVLRKGDNSVVRVPNAELSNQQVVNLSRIRFSQVKQKLRFHYHDVDKLPDILTEIKQEIKASCPRLISDGTRPFRVFWTNFNEDHLEVEVNTHYMIAPLGDAYWANRQNVLLAIHRVLRRNDVKLAELFQVTNIGRPPQWRALSRKLRENSEVEESPSLPGGSEIS